MKMFKRIFSAVLIAVFSLAVISLAACDNGEVTYNVNVKDALGNPYTTGVVVQFMKDGNQVAMQSCDENGVASKTLEKGTYNIALKFADTSVEYRYDTNLQVSASQTSVDVILAQTISSEAEPLFVEGTQADAFNVNAGCTYVELKAGERNYFLFTPAQAGTFEFSVVDNPDAKIGYYGAKHFVQSNSAVEVIDNKFTMSISDTMIGTDEGGTSILVIGIDLQGDKKDCVLAINRTGDPERTLEDEPWTVYEKTTQLSEYTLPEGATIEEFDLTASTDTYKLVYNEADGFYHLDKKDGPLVLVRLAEDCQYIDCFKTMLSRTGIVEYYFDENGDFEKKVSYSECLLEYIECVDDSAGVYPLTEDLKYIIQHRGEYADWWDFESTSFMFKDADGNNMPEINTEIAWLFMCCYIG